MATALLLVAAATAAQAQERVSVRRLSDLVAVRQGPADARTERVLYYFSPWAELVVDDEVEQGSGGHSELFLSEGGHVELHASARVVIRALSPARDVLRFVELTQARVTAGERVVTLRLPGGISCSLEATEAWIRREPGRLLIRNEGGQPVGVEGPFELDDTEQLSARVVLLERGEEMVVPIFDDEAPATGSRRARWLGRSVRHGDGYEASLEGRSLRLRRSAEATGTAVVAGVRVDLTEGASVLLTDRRAAAPMSGEPLERLDVTPEPEPEPEPPAAPRAEQDAEDPDDDAAADDAATERPTHTEEPGSSDRRNDS